MHDWWGGGREISLETWKGGEPDDHPWCERELMTCYQHPSLHHGMGQSQIHLQTRQTIEGDHPKGVQPKMDTTVKQHDEFGYL